MKQKIKIAFLSLLTINCVAIFGTTPTVNKLPIIADMVHNNPGETPYTSKFNNPDVLNEMGYNGKTYFIFLSPQLAVNWDKVDPDILPVGSPDRQWVDAKAVQIHTLYGEMKKTSLLRHAFMQIPSVSVVKIEMIEKSVLELNNEFMVTYFIGNTLYDKKFIFIKDSIDEKNVQEVPILFVDGVIVR